MKNDEFKTKAVNATLRKHFQEILELKVSQPHPLTYHIQARVKILGEQLWASIIINERQELLETFEKKIESLKRDTKEYINNPSKPLFLRSQLRFKRDFERKGKENEFAKTYEAVKLIISEMEPGIEGIRELSKMDTADAYDWAQKALERRNGLEALEK